MTPQLTGWIVFAGLIAAALALDLLVFNRRSHRIALREALVSSACWIALALAFNAWILATRGSVPALEFFTGYLVELSLSVDNLFVFLLLFAYFQVPEQHQHRVLFWGILGAIVFRLVFILAGVTLLSRFHWVIYVFGAILVVSGIRMATQGDTPIEPEKNPVLGLLRRLIPITTNFVDGRFFVRAQRLMATPLFVVLVMVETTDLIFAVDSIPAVLAITRDPFIVFSSNLFAILGLRAMFFALAGVMRLFHHLHYGLSLILVFIGLKMLISHWVEVPILITLGVVVGTIVLSVIASLVWPKPAEPDSPA